MYDDPGVTLFYHFLDGWRAFVAKNMCVLSLPKIDQVVNINYVIGLT